MVLLEGAVELIGGALLLIGNGTRTAATLSLVLSGPTAQRIPESQQA
jgi:uncharacterized membrane protein YphA (DoxX/SURF4 family)